MTVQVMTPAIAQVPAEQRLLLEGVSWQQYELLLATLGDDFPALRLSYLEGSLEIMTTSPLHEELKSTIRMLLEAFFQTFRIRYHCIGSATFRKMAKQRGLEPDECYCLGQKKDFPDLAIEIVLTSGLVDKLEIYRGLGVKEVWVWEAGQFRINHLREDGYEQLSSSELLPNCDIQLLASYVKPEEQFDAVMAFREQLRSLQ
ncbi:Uma2 family endonuclease [Pseudanabaena sp. PCC 6802]|uniref:Uma2 family endonuclease n=1 Tax=Pseudanabaena sp. PCC 6802 TaxID=118173 RepID=UPI00034A9D1F|nr:Uma2 family endonuclease [Pseudanabaena sp. PCC 6802]